MREKVVQVLERGKESVTQMRRIIHHPHHHQDLHDDHDIDGCLKLLKGQLDAYSLEVLTSFATALSMIHNFASFYNHHHDHQGLKRPNHHHHHHDVKCGESQDWDIPRTPRHGRGCNKRR